MGTSQPASNAPAETPFLTLAQVAGARWRIEQALEEAKGEAGMDEYEVRSWPGWHRHLTLSLLAQSWFTALRAQERAREKRGDSGPKRRSASSALAELTVAEIRRLLALALPLPSPRTAFRLAWSRCRRLKRQQARCSHYRRRGAL